MKNIYHSITKFLSILVGFLAFWHAKSVKAIIMYAAPGHFEQNKSWIQIIAGWGITGLVLITLGLLFVIGMVVIIIKLVSKKDKKDSNKRSGENQPNG